MTDPENMSMFNKSTFMSHSPPPQSSTIISHRKNCPLCSDPDVPKMITCSTCQSQFHPKCIKWNSETVVRHWICRTCRKAAEGKTRHQPERKPSFSSDAQAAISNQKHLKLLAELRLTKSTDNLNSADGNPSSANPIILPALSTGHKLASNFVPNLNSANIQPLNLKHSERVVVNSVSSSKSSKSSKSSARRKELALAQLEEERQLKEQRDKEFRELQTKRDEEYLAKKYAIEREPSEHSSSLSEQSEHRKSVSNWVKQQSLLGNSVGSKVVDDGVIENSSANFNHFQKLQPSMQIRGSCVDASKKAVVNNRNIPYLSARNGKEFMDSTSFNKSRNRTVDDDFNLSMKQIAVRQIVSKDLPIFSGNPMEWPIFIASYMRSTNACNFSDEENLARLQRCLKGRAFEAVKGKLIFPEMVPKVLSTLRMLFGRPQQILQLMIEQLRREPPIDPEKLESVIGLSIAVQHLCATMAATDMEDYLNDPLLLAELVKKLPGMLKLKWAEHIVGRTKVNLSTFDDWLSSLAEVAGGVISFDSAIPQPNKRDQKPTQSGHGRSFFNAAHHSDKKQGISSNFQKSNKPVKKDCVICPNEYHSISDCPKFKNMKAKERWDAMRSNRLCRKCLRAHHVTSCRHYKECGVDACIFKHHPLLHDPEIHSGPNRWNVRPEMEPSDPKQSTSKTVATHSVSFIKRPRQLLFRVLPVVLYGKSTCVSTYAFLDEGSSVTLLDREIADRLELDGPSSNLPLKWTGGTIRHENGSKRVCLHISGVNTTDVKYRIDDVQTVGSLELPVQSLTINCDNTSYSHLRGLPFHQYHDAKPRILLGIEHWQLGAPYKTREGNFGEPIATKTRLGWIVFGAVDQHLPDREPAFVNHIATSPDDELHELVKNFFSTENFGVVGSATAQLTKDEKRAMAILENSTQREKGRYSTGLLWRYDNIQLPNSFPMAMRRMLTLEKKMDASPQFAEILVKHIQGYVDKGYARRLSKEEVQVTTPRTWYLPIFTVTNPNKPSKVRVVWDAAAEANGVSLNSVLLKGPDLLSPLSDILQRFREKPFAVTADIREMFHQVGISKTDQDSQRFLFRGLKREGPPDVFVMTVMTFGASCSPSSAQYIKNTNAARFQQSNPRAYFAIRHNHYVDDWLDGFSSEKEAVAIAKEVVQIHAEGGFEIRNFVSNSRFIQRELGGSAVDAINLNASGDCCETTEAAKVLGIWWSTSDDAFYYNVNVGRIPLDVYSGKRNPTKREMLRIVMSVFDPLGLIANYVVYAKILLRDVWKSGTSWDEPINDDTCERWRKWIVLLPKLREIRIPRCYTPHSYQRVELHVFVDASETAFAAAAYLRFTTDNHVQSVLVSAKSRVAPQNIMTIPRLELQAALLGARLATSVSRAHSFKINCVTMWSDSIDVLSWIFAENKKQPKFVAFRVSDILSHTKRTDWRWVPTDLNVADQATKWKNYPDLSPGSPWFNGPKFLLLSEGEWPRSDRLKLIDEDPQETIGMVLSHASLPQTSIVPETAYITKWRVLVRSTALALRFLSYGKSNTKRHRMDYRFITKLEFQRAEEEIYRMIQNEAFPSVIARLKRGEDLKTEQNSFLHKRTPFLDDKMIMRTQGRIYRVEGVSYDAINPIILPKNHEVTRKIVESYHERFHHRNHETVVNEIRQKYDIAHLREVLKKIRSKCQSCKIERAKPFPPQMGDHPFGRVATFMAPFSYTGLDYFGPLEVVVGRHVEKRWVALFTCLTIRAVHLEIVYTLTTKSCMMALRNFIARRGKPLEIFTDNGTNFRGTSNYLAELRRLKSAISTEYTKNYDDISWKFNPPSAPHMGGCWERLVRSVKTCVYSSMPTRRPNDETLRCFLMEAESIVNTRPLTYIPVDPEEEEAITPNHFLLGSSSGTKSFSPFENNTEALVKNFELSQTMADRFWTRFVKEYLPIITRCTKWFEKTKNIEPGDFVMMMDEKQRNSWRRGVVVEVFTGGRSNQVRRVVIRTPDGLFERPAVKVAILDVAPNKFSKVMPNRIPLLGGV